MNNSLFSIRDLHVQFDAGDHAVPALRGVNLEVARGECLGLVGESGSGKSLTALATLGLLPRSATAPKGTITYDGIELLSASERKLEALRGNEISMIFQEPMTALNPVMKVGEQIAAPLRKHKKISRREAKEKAIEQLKLVGLPDPEKRFGQYPHELSGGMRQRVMIAMALACEPKLLIADEPTTALDVTIQAQILELLKRLQKELDLAVIIITHDFGVIAEVADRVCVMYGGRIVEAAPAEALFDNAGHPYSQGLMRSTPDIDMPQMERLPAIGGAVPHLKDMPNGCAFHPRCPERRAQCDTQAPPLEEYAPRQRVACWARETQS
jgi:oligopeptide/dipeptide ABC transporter ATP-binding protein